MKLAYLGKCQPGNGPKYGHIYDVIYMGKEKSKYDADGNIVSGDDNNNPEVFVIKYVLGNEIESTTMRIEHQSIDEISSIWRSLENYPNYTPKVTSHCKLVRDKIPEVIFESGDFPEFIRIRDNEMIIAQLENKLTEEVNEYLKDRSIDELVDIYEVILGILYHKNISFEDFDNALLQKRESRGGFATGIYLKSTIEQEAKYETYKNRRYNSRKTNEF